ncbi:unnamed protein product [Bursaphelenchus xylophilus]|uniref:(pine wood nematode) hypothetical protein n=1 Tax=Bursaphelenchus xylophilus TaxID=6326 RepID=A0A1I7RY15_BURXY|nr:unnamed protein product [Bursaphelenchus xylophilus]CAG9085183.1 unnamed protein product [Bursaphelenchus xylophilus]
MNPKEQQEQEVEILEAAYPDELEILNREYPNIKVKVTIPSVPKWENPDPDFYLELEIRLPAQYPDVAPEFEISGFPMDFPLKCIEEVYQNMRTAAYGMLGFQVMITLISEIQNSIPTTLKRLEKEKSLEERRIQDEKEEAEQRKFEGNRVTVESFNEWRVKFEKEFLAAELDAKRQREAELAGKLTGKQQFLRDATLSISDLGMLEEEKTIESVEIDQSLFEEELSDLDISGDGDDESD